MIPADNHNEQLKELTADEITGVRNAWGCGVPLSLLARQRGIDEQELRRQLGLPDAALIGLREVQQMREKRRQLEALREIFGGRLDG